MDSEEVTWWMGFSNIIPLPDPWLQTGIICSTMANIHCAKKGSKGFSPEQFMPCRKAAKKQSQTEMKARMEAIAAQANNAFNKK